MTLLLDTNVVSETRRRMPDHGVMAWLDAADPQSLYISVLTVGEIARGAEMKARRDPTAGQALNHWLGGLAEFFADRLVPVDRTTAETWGRLAARRTIPVVDGLLAATAKVRGMALVTRNESDFAGLGIDVINPWRS